MLTLTVGLTVKWSVLNREHAEEHLGINILLTLELCWVRSGIMSIDPEEAP